MAKDTPTENGDIIHPAFFLFIRLIDTKRQQSGTNHYLSVKIVEFIYSISVLLSNAYGMMV